jgi:hypothetical protein
MDNRLIIAGMLFGTTSLLGSDYSFINEDTFTDQNKIWHFESDYSRVASANFLSSDIKNAKLHYQEGNASTYFAHFLNQENALVWQLGVNYVGLGWNENPRFTGNDYLYGITSLTWVSHAIDHWRWVINGGVAVDTKTWNFGKSAVYYSTLWGRYCHSKTMGIHLGFFAYYGALNGYVLPILGFDWHITPQWDLRAIFPLDASINYHFNEHFTTSIMATSMGGPYRFPRRAHGGIGEFDEAIFKVYSTALEWDIKFMQKNCFSIGAGAGWDFGGWIQTSDAHNHHKKYYHFDSAPYGRIFATITL